MIFKKKKQKKDIIFDMCMTYRHDFGLLLTDKEKELFPFAGGLIKQEQERIYNDMKQIFENCIEQYIDKKKVDLDGT